MSKIHFRALALFIVSSAISLSALPASAEYIALGSPDFTADGKVHELVEYRGRTAMKLQDAVIKNTKTRFGNGTIEFDIALPHERGFAGIRFHVDNGDKSSTMEEFYIRPHQRGNPDATQYTPVFNSAAGWQLYHGRQYSNDFNFEADIWQHVKIVVSGARADIYLNDMENVALAIPELKSGIDIGGIQLFSNFVPAYFANLQVTENASPSLKGQPTPLPPTPDSRIKSWAISSAFSDDSLGEPGLLEIDVDALDWAVIASEEDGITNIARFAKLSRQANTSLAKVTLTAESDLTTLLKFGYSDKVRVYLNGEELYRGTNGFRSRDYRYLGTIGLFDEVPLRLTKGRNELLLAVTESFGGWGVMGDIKERAGLNIQAN